MFQCTFVTMRAEHKIKNHISFSVNIYSKNVKLNTASE